MNYIHFIYIDVLKKMIISYPVVCCQGKELHWFEFHHFGLQDLANTLLALSLNMVCSDQMKRLLLSLTMCIGEWCMNIPAETLLERWPQPSSPPLLETVFQVLELVATGRSSSSATFRTMNIETDDLIDNVGEFLSTSSPQVSPLSSPAKQSPYADTNQQRPSHFKTSTNESEENVKAVRLAARIVSHWFPFV